MRIFSWLPCVLLCLPACAGEPTPDDSAKVCSLAIAEPGEPAASPAFPLSPLQISAGKPTGFEDANGRAFWPTGMITGGGTDGHAAGWPLIDDATLQQLHDSGGNFTHVRLGPFVRWLAGPDAEAYRFDEASGRYDLGVWNDAFWNRLDHVLTRAEELGIYVEVDLVDGWTMKDHNEPPPLNHISPWQPFNNLNGATYDCDHMMPPGQTWHLAWLRKVAEVTGPHPNVVYEVGNETNTCAGMGPAWEQMVVTTMRASLPDARLFSTNSKNPAIENAPWIDYVNRHRPVYPDPQPLIWNKPAGINEYGDADAPTFTTEVWHAFVRGTFLHYWWGSDDGPEQTATLAALQFFHTVIGKADIGRYTPQPIVDERLVGRRHRDYLGYFPGPAQGTLFIDELGDPEDRYDVRWYDPRARLLKSVEVRHGGGPQGFGTPADGLWVLHVNRQELSPQGLWLDERFDDLTPGLLERQHGWTRIDDSPAVAGGAVVIHAAGRPIAIDKDVPIQTGGKHRLDVRVRVLDSTAATMAKLEVKSLPTASPLDDKKFQLTFGGDRFRISRIGVPERFVIPPGGVQLGHWYSLRCDIDLDAGTVAVYVDGAPAVPAFAMKAGPITDVQMMGFDVGPTGSVEVDDLRAGNVRFFDVPRWHPFYRAVEAVARAGITAGCGLNLYCPDDPVTRAQLAVFLLRAEHGPVWIPPPAHGLFADVPAGDPFAAWAEALFGDGVIGSCSSFGLLYCPASASSRADMAGYLLRAKHGGAYQPPAPSRFFADVAPDDPQLAWIDQLYREQITGGCAIDPLRYCPSSMVTRGEAAAFVTAAFALPVP